MRSGQEGCHSIEPEHPRERGIFDPALSAARRVDRMMATSVRRWLLGAVVFTIACLTTAPALAAPTIELTRGSTEPVESVATQLGGVVNGGGGDYFYLHVKPTGGEGCGANPDADAGESVITSFVTTETNPVSFTQNWTFRLAGDYRVCTWVTSGNTESVLTSAEVTLHVRPPHLALSVSVPASVTIGQTFQVVTTAQAETERSVIVYAIPNTGDGCPANADAARNTSSSRTILNSWNVTGGPLTESRNESLQTPGVYLFCAYVEYPSSESTPELTASAQTSVVAPPPPCVVPGFAFGSALGSVERVVRAASCSVGAIHYAASRSVRRGGVLGLNPRPGARLAAGARVAIDVSAGRPCVVPFVKPGTSLHRAERLLDAADCRAVTVRAHSRHVHRGAVIGLGSRAHSHLSPLARVRVVVSSGH